MKRNIQYVCMAILLVFASCTEDFFDDKGKKGELDESTFYSSILGLGQATIAAYTPLSMGYDYDLYGMVLGSIASDDADAGGQNSADQPDMQSIDLFNQNSSNKFLKSFWAYGYKGIYYSNLVIGHGENFLREQNPEESSPVYRYLGEAYFLRALYYFNLNIYFGGVPILLEESVGDVDVYNNTGRSTVSQTFEQIKSDLIKAKDLLLSREETDALDLGRATKEAAWALLAKTYLYESSYAKNYSSDSRFAGCVQHYDSVYFYAELVINSPSQQLVGLDGETYPTAYSENTPAYKYIFTVEGDNCPESVFEVQYQFDPVKEWINSKGNAINIFASPRNYKTRSGRPSSIGGFGFNCPTQDLLNEFETGDPRLKYSISQNGDSIYIAKGGDPKTLAYEPIHFGSSPTGMFSRKQEVHPNHFWLIKGSDNNDGPTNHRIIRMADVYLMAAEAYLEDGEMELALNYLNMVRQRARNSGTSGNPAALASVSLSDIVHERRVEFAMEDSRFTDLVRWRLAGITLNGKMRGSSEVLVFVEGKHEFFPIHNDNILSSNGKIVQNPGY